METLTFIKCILSTGSTVHNCIRLAKSKFNLIFLLLNEHNLSQRFIFFSGGVVQVDPSGTVKLCRPGGSNSNTQWAKIKKWVLVEGRTGSMFIAKLIEMNLLHIFNLELTKLK